MNPDNPPVRPEPKRPARTRTLRIWALLGLLVLLVAVNAIGLTGWQLPQRLQVGLANNTDLTIHNVWVEHDGHDIPLGSVDPYDRVERRISTRWSGKVRITFDVGRGDGPPDRHVESEVTHRWEPGDSSIRFDFYGSTIDPVLNDKIGLMYEQTFKITPLGQP